MTREEAKALLPIIKAFSEGKDIELYSYTNDCWCWKPVTKPFFDYYGVKRFRIKPEAYRPFKNAEECWQEMQKHQPFGWLKDKEDGHYALITAVNNETDTGCRLSNVGKSFTFADGAAFGIKLEE